MDKSTSRMLIRKPVAEVFEAFVDPSVTTRFWFTHGSGRLEKDARVEWTWEMYDLTAEVRVVDFEPESRIVTEWAGADGQAQTVDWRFEPHDEGTVVTVVESGFPGEGEELVAQVVDSAQGFTMVLVGAKAYLEHGVRLNLVVDGKPG